MKKIIKSVLNLKTILSSYIGAVGYGIGYNLPNKFNCHPITCLICCFLLGTIFDKLAEKLVSSNYFEKSKKNKIIIATFIYALYLVAWAIVDKTLNYDLDYDFLFNIEVIIVIQIVLLVINIIKNIFRYKKEGE